MSMTNLKQFYEEGSMFVNNYSIETYKCCNVYVTHIDMINYRMTHFTTTLSIFSYLQIFPWTFGVFYRKITKRSLLFIFLSPILCNIIDSKMC